MSTQTHQEYVVHLDIRARAADPDEAVQEALTLVKGGALSSVVFSVEAVGPAEPAAGSATAESSAAERAAVIPAQSPVHRETYRGEFLG